MSLSRREFVQNVAGAAAVSLAGGAIPGVAMAQNAKPEVVNIDPNQRFKGPISVASANGINAVALAVEKMRGGADAVDAVVAGVNLVENDPSDHSVGYGGLPNEEGVVELDASVMHGPTGKCGSVAAVRNIKNPSSVALLVMRRTDHVLLVGEGALRFARAHGFPEENLLTDEARQIWLKWKESMSATDDWLSDEQQQLPEGAALFDPNDPRYDPRFDPNDPRYVGVPRRGQDMTPDPTRARGTFIAEPSETSQGGFSLEPYLLPGKTPHGTINCLGLDAAGNLSGTTTTSGLAFKLPGRVGDSPIIGAGLYVDNEVGAAGSTGRGEANLQNCSSFLIVEFMRSGKSPQEACLEALKRIAAKAEPRLRSKAGEPNFDLSFYAVSKDGRVGGAVMRGSGRMAFHDGTKAVYAELPGLYKRP